MTRRSGYCWGFGRPLGAGTIINSNSPVPVGGGLSFAFLDAGNVHTCGVTTAAAAFCWGEGGSGQLGNGSMTDEDTPVLVAPVP